MPFNYPVVLIPRTCARCGSQFGAFSREHICRSCKKRKPVQRPESNELSPRERQIADLVQQAKANKEIAAELGLTAGTVKEYLRSIFRKLGINNRTELALWGMRNSMLAHSVRTYFTQSVPTEAA